MAGKISEDALATTLTGLVFAGVSGGANVGVPAGLITDAVMYRGAGDGSTNNLGALTAALTEAAGGCLCMPAGVFVIDASAPDLQIADYTHIVGAGRGRTILEFRNLGSDSHGLAATNKTGIRIRGLTLKAQSALTANQDAVLFYECNDCSVEDVEQINFSSGFVFDAAAAPSSTPTWGNRNRAVHCLSNGSRAYGFFSQAQCGTLWMGNESCGATNLDGFKTGRGNRAHRIDACYSHDNNADGFDTYDGFIDSVIVNCISENNGAGGYQFKGTFDGSYDADDYVTRSSIASNLIARGNGINGFLFQEVRGIIASGLMAADNIGHGICFNNVQALLASTLHAIRNTKDGVNIQGGSARNRFSGIMAVDNSYVEGTTQNGTYHGVHIESGSDNFLSGISAFIGTQVGKQGGQGYGIFTGAASGNTIAPDFWCSSNVSGMVGGTNPFLSNVFGSRRGTVIDAMGPGTPEGVISASVGSVWSRTDGGAGTSRYIKESGSGNTGWVAK